MPPAVRAVAVTQGGGTAVLELTLTLPTFVAGDRLEARVAARGDVDWTAPTTDWVKVSSARTAVGSDLGAAVFVKTAVSGEVAPKFTVAGGVAKIVTGALAAIQDTDGVDTDANGALIASAQVEGVNTATSWNCPSVTTQGTDRLLMAGGFSGDDRTSTPPTGFTEHYDDKNGTSGPTVTVTSKVQAAAGATGIITGTWSSGTESCGILVAYKPAITSTPITAAGDTASFALTAQDGTGVPGPLAVAGDAAAWPLVAQDGAGVPGPLTVAGDGAPWTLTAQDGTGVAGALAVVGDTAGWSLLAQDGTPVVGPLVVAGDTAPFELQAQDGTVALGALVVTGDTAPWELVAQDGTVVSIAAIVALGDTAPWTLEPQVGAPLAGAVTVAGDTATWLLSAQDGVPVLGGLIVAGDTAPWALTAQDGSTLTGAVVVIGDSASWALVAQDGSVFLEGLVIQAGRAVSTRRSETVRITDRQGAYTTRVGGFK